MRKKIVAGNWKMNLNKQAAKELLQQISTIKTNATVVVCPPFTLLDTANEILNNSNIALGCQNMHFEQKGAYTGEISTQMLQDFNVSYAIIGHSERRTYYNETDIDINKKVICALQNNITPIICVGETLQQRENGKHCEVVVAQVEKALKSIEDTSKVVIAYEPIWAIGTGKTASSSDANQMCQTIRNSIVGGENVSILYGGSMNEQNVCELMSMEHIDGGLIGSASLTFEKFSKLMTYDI